MSYEIVLAYSGLKRNHANLLRFLPLEEGETLNASPYSMAALAQIAELESPKYWYISRDHTTADILLFDKARSCGVRSEILKAAAGADQFTICILDMGSDDVSMYSTKPFSHIESDLVKLLVNGPAVGSSILRYERR